MNIPIATIMMDVLARYRGKTITPESITDICTDVIGTCYPGPVDTSAIAPKIVGNYKIQCNPVPLIIAAMQDKHKEHWQETEVHRHDVEFDINYERMFELDVQGKYVMISVEHTPTATLVGNSSYVLETCMYTQTLSAYEDVLYVSPDHRRGRLGVELIRYGEAVLQQLGAQEVTLSAKTVTNLGPMLVRMGYEQVGTLHNKRLTENSHVRKRA